MQQISTCFPKCLSVVLFFLAGICCSYSQTWNAPVTAVTSLTGGEYANSMQVINGAPAIAYFDDNGSDLKYVRATDATGSSWGLPVTIDAPGGVGPNSSLKVINGNPAISYWDASNRVIKYVRAADADGTSWNAPVVVGASTFEGLYSSLLVVDGNPAIAYFNYGSGDLYYVRANDASGTSWGTPVLIDATDFAGYYCSMEIVNGNPAIGYMVSDGDNNYFVKYIRSTDVSGTVWGAGITVANTGFDGKFSVLKVVDGNPAIAYKNENNELQYVRASDISGSTWNSPLTVDGSGNTSDYGISMEIVDGDPAIAYYSSSDRSLQYVIASDVSGTSWNAPVTLDGGSDEVGKYPAMMVSGSHPAIAYYDETNGSLLFISSTDFVALPVTLLQFTGAGSSGNNLLRWSSASEESSSYYEVERSKDGTHFSAIARVNASHNSSTVRNYSYTDYTFLPVSYYRLKMVDIDGQLEYSKTIIIRNITGKNNSTVFPNPTNGMPALTIADNKLLNTTAILSNMNGSVVSAFIITQSTMQVNLTGCARGVYLLHLSNGENIRIVKE